MLGNSHVAGWQGKAYRRIFRVYMETANCGPRSCRDQAASFVLEGQGMVVVGWQYHESRGLFSVGYMFFPASYVWRHGIYRIDLILVAGRGYRSQLADLSVKLFISDVYPKFPIDYVFFVRGSCDYRNHLIVGKMRSLNLFYRTAFQRYEPDPASRLRVLNAVKGSATRPILDPMVRSRLA